MFKNYGNSSLFTVVEASGYKQKFKWTVGQQRMIDKTDMYN
jgi:hypothetical protein